MKEKIVYYCKGSERMKLCNACENLYYSDKKRVDNVLIYKGQNLFKIDDAECKHKNAKFFVSKIKN